MYIRQVGMALPDLRHQVQDGVIHVHAYPGKSTKGSVEWRYDAV